MSEYQYYEFLAIDRPLTEREMQELRAVSSRAVITPTRFTNHYEWGNFKGDPGTWMERYFDAFLYFANWGTHELMLRLPRRVLDPATARRYCRGEAASARAKGEHVILEFSSEEEGSDWVEEDEDGSLSSLVPLRAEIASGDLRALYLGWLLCAQAGELDDDEEEPPCPPGLGRLSAALEAFVDGLAPPFDHAVGVEDHQVARGELDDRVLVGPGHLGAQGFAGRAVEPVDAAGPGPAQRRRRVPGPCVREALEVRVVEGDHGGREASAGG